MKAFHYHRLVILLATLIAGSFLTGCDEETTWQHPNRQRYPAPPEQKSDSMSFEELQRTWREQDRLARDHRQLGSSAKGLSAKGLSAKGPPPNGQSLNGRSPDGRSPDGQSATGDMLDLALGQVGSAIEAALSRAGLQRLPDDEQEATGAGPVQGRRPSSDDETGEM